MDLFRIIAAKPAQTAQAIKRKVEFDCAAIFNNADNTTIATGADGRQTTAVYKFSKFGETLVGQYRANKVN